MNGLLIDHRVRIRICGLLLFHSAVCSLSLVVLAGTWFEVPVDPALFHIFYDSARMPGAVAIVAAFSVVAIAFCFASFSFGYAVGFYFYTMISGYLWLNCFSDLNYDHKWSAISAIASAVTFLLPALFIVSPVRQVYSMSNTAFDRLLNVMLVVAAAAVASGALYNFRLVGLGNIYDFRNSLESPAVVRYAIAISSATLLPFIFAGSVARKSYLQAGAALLLLLLIYPVTLSKLALFAPFWLVAILLLSRFFAPKTAVITSLLAPVLTGLILHVLLREDSVMYVSVVNLRLVAIPSNSLDIYNDFFFRHEPTYFCQITLLKRLMECPYQEPLWSLMEKAYNLGNFNASLFASEGIASVGSLLAPVATFGCGLVIALGNRLSAGLPPRFILLSGAVLLPVLLNVPLTIVLNTHGGALMFLLWYITPRTIFEDQDAAAVSPRPVSPP
jgi:hypothetical protein